MRLPRFRFSIRTFMAALAVATFLIVVGIPVVTWMRQREWCVFAAEYHEEKEQAQRQTLNGLASLRSRGLAQDPLLPIVEDLARRRLAFHTDMKRKWRKAAANPWADASSDPDEPTDDRIVKKFDLPSAKYFTDDVKYIDPATVRTSTDVSPP